jgi:malonyl-CoA O-methyltransferase
MIPIKRKIQEKFSAASHTYNDVAHVQKESALILVKNLHEFITGFNPKTILDLGTGTGYLTEALLQHYPSSFYSLNDIAPGMISFVQNKFKHHSKFSFYESDMENGNFEPHNLIVSNLSMQWVESLEKTIQKFYSKSDVFSFSSLLDGTFREWNNILKNFGLPSALKQYPTENNLTNFLYRLGTKNHHFYVKEFQVNFNNIRSFFNYLKKLGASASDTKIPFQEMVRIIKNHNLGFSITYKIFFAVVKRK